MFFRSEREGGKETTEIHVGPWVAVILVVMMLLIFAYGTGRPAELGMPGTRLKLPGAPPAPAASR